MSQTQTTNVVDSDITESCCSISSTSSDMHLMIVRRWLVLEIIGNS